MPGMSFLNKLYFVEAESLTADGVTYVIRMNPQHKIYAAHFPGDPITPGVCILQIGLELLRNMHVCCTLELVLVKNVKFLSILRPDGNQVYVRIHNIVEDEDRLKAQMDFSTLDQTVAKMSLICKKTAK